MTPTDPAGARLRIPRRLRKTALYAVGAGLVVAFGFAVQHDDVLVRLELALIRGIHDLVPAQAVALAGAATDLAATPAVLLVGGTAALSLLARGQWHSALALSLSVGATQGVVFLLKALVARSRPPESAALVHADGAAFPSAHAASSVALYGLLAFFVLRRVRGRVQIAVAALALLFVGGIGATRVYLGAHYPSDVLAGWVVGGLVAAAGWQLARALRRRSVAAA